MGGEGFVEGMRANGECKHHPGQPFYSCPECSKLRQQKVGGEIADSLKSPKVNGQKYALVSDPVPVHITQRAQEHLLSAVRNFRRSRIEGRVLAARDRTDRLPPAPNPEAEISQKHLDRLEADADEAGVEVEGFDVVVRVYLDKLGVSGISPEIDMVEPLLIENFDKDYRIYTYGSLRVAVELQHMNYLRGLIIEWHDRLDKSGFVIRHMQGEWTVQDR